jgi:tetratricopeptide (TPR) repeat protein
MTVGLLALNSAWLQISSGDYKGRLSVDPRQINAITDNSPSKWTSKNTHNILFTHHPSDWLHKDALALWHSEINPSGRFDIHLFGHMHEPDATSHSHGGGEMRRSLQGASLFGLERIERSQILRIHGYSVGKIIDKKDGSAIRIWPRILQTLTDGSKKLVPDHSLNLDDDDSFALTLPQVQHTSSSVLASKANTLLFTDSSEEQLATLDRARYSLFPSAASRNVRSVEQREALVAIREKRAFWLISDWGAGSDGFISSLQLKDADTKFHTFSVELESYSSRDDFLSTIKTRLNFSLEQFCEAVSGGGPSYLIMDNVPAPGGPAGAASAIETDLEDMVDAILQYCPALRIILRSRHTPRVHAYNVVELKPLDEADLRTYVLEHERGGPNVIDQDTIDILFRCTDGVPARIDAALRELEVTSIESLASANPDITRVRAEAPSAPKGLAEAITSLADSADPTRKRSLELLKALSEFPSGESLDRLKRFNGPYPLFPAHAIELLENSLITPLPSGGITTQSESGKVKLLLVPRIVRDYVRSVLTSVEIAGLTKNSATLYFGDKWQNGAMSSASIARFVKPTTSSGEINNANALIIRLLNDAVGAGNEVALKNTINLAATYAGVLYDGDHFRSVATLCRDIISSVPEDRHADLVEVKYSYAKSLRMIGSHEEARHIFESFLGDELAVTRRCSVLLNLALICQSLQEPDEAAKAAQQIIKLDRNSNFAHHAKAIMLEVRTDNVNREQDLLRHEAICRKKGAATVANNLALSRVRVGKNIPANAENDIDKVIKSAAEERDFYSMARAIIKKAKIIDIQHRVLSDVDKRRLIDAYHFLFNERLKNLFDDCHAALWNVFEATGETLNLFRLFRHSSLIWRLRGDDEQEQGYLQKLAKQVGVTIQVTGTVDREVAYYLVRVSV